MTGAFYRNAPPKANRYVCISRGCSERLVKLTRFVRPRIRLIQIGEV